jgi:translation elongation factor EF-1alpha
LKQHVNITVVGQRGVGKTLLCKRLLSWYHKNLVAPSGSEEPEYPDSDEDVNEYFDNFVLEEEKSGTIESGRSYLETKHKRVTLIDTPGHPVLQA